MGSMTKMASTPSGAESLLKMLPEDAATFGGFGSLTSLISNLFSGGPTGNSMLSSLLGPGLNAIGGSLTRLQCHAIARPGCPSTMGLVSKAVQTDKLDGNGLAELLKRETTQFAVNPANAATMKLVNEATAAGEKAATVIGSYGADWNKVAAAPVAALLAVSSSDLDGPFDTMKEVKAAQAALLEATKPRRRFGAGGSLRWRPDGECTQVGARDGEGSRRPDAPDRRRHGCGEAALAGRA